MRATLSILGLYDYDNSIFDNMSLPTGINKEDVVDNLLFELSEFEVLYPTPGIMKSAIGYWSKKELPVWEKLFATTVFDYDPLTNLKRDETFTTTEIRDLAGSDIQNRDLSGSNTQNRDLSGSDTETRNLSGGGTHHSETSGSTTNNGTDTQKEYNSGFNSNTPVQAKQTEQTLGTGNSVSGTVDNNDTSTDTGTVKNDTTDTGTVTNNTTDTGTVTNSKTDTGTVTTNNTSHASGSIGVITNQQFIMQERQVSEFNIINYIIDSFKNRFCILVY